MVVEVGADGGDAVGEGAEGRHPRGAEKGAAVGVLRTDRRAPHHTHQLVRLLRRVHQILGELVAHRREGPGDRADQYADGRVGQDRVEDLAAAPVADRVPAVVDRIGDVQILRYPLVQFGLLGGAEGGQPQAGRGRQVGEVGAGATGDRIDGDALGGGLPGAGQQRRGVLQLVEPVHPDHTELPHRGVHDLVRAGELAGVRGGRPGAGLGAADLDGDDGHLVAGGAVGGQQKAAAVLEPFHICGDGADLGAGGEVGEEVGGLQIGLVAGGGPVRKADAQFLEAEDGTALVA